MTCLGIIYIIHIIHTWSWLEVTAREHWGEERRHMVGQCKLNPG